MENLFTQKDVIQLVDQDITNQWVVIKPEVIRDVFKPEYVSKSIQVAKARCGFGCKEGSLSVRGGKVYVTLSDDIDDQFYRNEIMGIAKPHVLEELGIEVQA